MVDVNTSIFMRARKRSDRLTIRRRLFIALSAGALVRPWRSHAQQQGKVWRVGILSSRARSEFIDTDLYTAFRQGLRDLGYVEGKNLIIDARFSEGKTEPLSDLVAELMLAKMDVIVTTSTPATSAAQKATSTTPIIMTTVSDPVALGFVKTLSRPGGNITGLTNTVTDLGPKHVEMLLSVAPKLSRIGVLVNPGNAGNVAQATAIGGASQKNGLQAVAVEARSEQEIEKAFAVMIRERVSAVVVAQDPIFVQQRRRIAELAIRHRLPSIGAIRDFAEAGVLLSYGPSYADIYRRAATYVDKILKGIKPANLPVEQPMKFELFLNRKTASALGIAVPQDLLLRADKVIG